MLLQNVAGKTDGNFVSSALSAHVVLSMAAYGADGKNKEEMRQTLHLPEKDEVAHEGFQHFIHTINVSCAMRFSMVLFCRLTGEAAITKSWI